MITEKSEGGGGKILRHTPVTLKSRKDNWLNLQEGGGVLTFTLPWTARMVYDVVDSVDRITGTLRVIYLNIGKWILRQTSEVVDEKDIFKENSFVSVFRTKYHYFNADFSCRIYRRFIFLLLYRSLVIFFITYGNFNKVAELEFCVERKRHQQIIKIVIIKDNCLNFLSEYINVIYLNT